MDKKNTTESVGVAQARPSTVRFTLDVPIELNKKLVAEAKAEKRSRHKQILIILERVFENGNGSFGQNGEKQKEAEK
jgi:hypothetical protein